MVNFSSKLSGAELGGKNKMIEKGTSNIVFSPLESFNVNITNVKAFTHSIEKHINTFDAVDDIVRKDFIKALRNISACAALLPDLMTGDMSSMMMDPKKILDIGSVQVKHIWEDLQIVYHFCVSSIDTIGKDDPASKTLIAFPLVRFLFSAEGDEESMERIAKRLVEHVPVYLNRGRDYLRKHGKYDSDNQRDDNNYASSDDRKNQGRFNNINNIED